MNDDKQYPELPTPYSYNYVFTDPTSGTPVLRTEASVWNGQHPKMSIGMFTPEQLIVFADATCTLRANSMFLKERAKLDQEWVTLNAIIKQQEQFKP